MITNYSIKVMKEEYREFKLGHFPEIQTLQQLVERRINKIVGQELTIAEFLEFVEEEK